MPRPSRSDAIDLAEMRAFAAPVVSRAGWKFGMVAIGSVLNAALHPLWQSAAIFFPLGAFVLAEYLIARHVLRTDLEGEPLKRAARASWFAALGYAVAVIVAAFVVVMNDPLDFELRVVAYSMVLAGIFDAGLLLGVNRRATEWRIAAYGLGGTALLITPFAIRPSPEFVMDCAVVLMMTWISYVFLSDVRRSRAEQAETNDILSGKVEENRHLVAMVENATDGIVLVRRDGLIEWTNRGFLDQIGLPGERIVGQFQQTFLAPESPAEAVETINARFQDAKPVRAELRLVRGDGAILWVEVSMTPLPNDQGRATHYINVVRDVTEARRKASQLADARRTAERAAQEKATFLATMSHEIRTPMNGVVGVAELLSETSLDARQVELVETIATSGEYLLRIIDDILNLSKLESGRMEICEEAFSPKDLLRTSSAILTPLAERKGIELSLSILDEMPETLIGDAGRIRQILINLGGNAIKFTETGSVKITLSAPMDGGTRRLSLSVADSGVGIPKDRIEEIFDSFRQADNSISREFGGTGLGLSISRLLAKAMDGGISVVSTVGTGSVFTLDLPFREGMVDAPAPSPTVEGAARLEPGAGGAAPPLVLVVDDNATNRFVMERMLKDGPWTVRFAADGREAVEMCLDLAPDMVFMDLSMPVLDGFEAARRIRANDSAGGLRITGPIVALTANAGEADRQRTVEAGMVDFLAKPVRKKALVATVGKWTGHHAQDAGNRCAGATRTDGEMPSIPSGARDAEIATRRADPTQA